MPTYDLAFVDSITASPTTRLNLHTTGGGWQCLADATSFAPPELDRVASESMLADGAVVSSSAYRNRTVTLALEASMALTDDAAAALVQSLAREIDRPTGNFLRYRAGTTAPIFFRTYRSGFDAIAWDPLTRRATVSLLAEPFAYGLKETLSGVVVYNDPFAGGTLNLNPFFETDVSDWTVAGGTFVRSTAQFHEGVASGLLTPNGVAATVQVDTGMVVIPGPGTPVQASAWLRCAVARSVNLNVTWYTAAAGFLSASTLTIAVVANTWTLFDFTPTAPALAFRAGLVPSMTGTPAAGHLLHIDEARLRVSSDAGGMCLDIAAPKGDVDTPLHITFSNGGLGGGGVGVSPRVRSALAMRRRGTPSATPLVLQAEAMTMSTGDTTVQANSALMSGAGSNYVRTTFASTSAMVNRLQTTTQYPPVGTDGRGTYRVFARVRQNTGADVIDVRLLYGSTNVQVTNDTVRLPLDTGPGAPTIKYVDLGLMQIPVGYDPVYDGVSGVEIPTKGAFLVLQAQRVSGSGSLDVDLLLFLPADDRTEFIKWPAVQAFSTDTYVAVGGPSPAAYCLNSNGQIESVEAIEIAGGGMMVTPGRANRLFFVRDVGTETAFNASGDSIASATTLTPSYFPRYLLPVRPVST